MRLFLLNYLLLLSICVVRAQERSDFYFTHVNGENGLSASNVKAILQDSYGFMWFGTKDGVNRYDGLDFRVFKQKIGDKNALLTVPAIYDKLFSSKHELCLRQSPFHWRSVDFSDLP